MKKGLLMMLLALILVIAACGGQTEESKEKTKEGTLTEGSEATEETSELVIGLIPSQSEGEMETAMDKLQAELEEKLGRPVKIDHYPAYNGVVEALNYGHIDMAYFGPLTYVIAHERSGAQAIITQLVNGEPYYHSYFITKADAPWETLDELLEDKENVSLAFGSPSSTSGSLIPGVELKERGVFRSEDDHDFAQVTYTGSHDITAQSVLNGSVLVGAIDSAIFEAQIRSGKLNADDFKIVWKSERIFQYPWAVKPNMDTATITALQEAFVSITDEDILNAFGATAFTTATNEDYDAIRNAAIIDGRMDDDLGGK
ncbi:phosphate/phosphite/phosphonate ABC transporter substrate-binding protein [Anaerobacillus alkaliphilus]|uniref:Phosphate/phosphite/phosphonate ABC transporter substrate-binding protein n=1 Tax=Anaerobacillus alkaliphilus TaxID=1548597 RepID=A0A4Q0VRQ1_9BACI|nr:phosphate/phosphite/phosphonate ABC transporter substrate-binding protein [Anaerobacillus alkaliphilus]RXI98597.1 phosphate/phosphite/phosphonate ABC transporter substrate-binding protein [Anaerobacillus alkaliphilus]